MTISFCASIASLAPSAKTMVTLKTSISATNAIFLNLFMFPPFPDTEKNLPSGEQTYYNSRYGDNAKENMRKLTSFLRILYLVHRKQGKTTDYCEKYQRKTKSPSSSGRKKSSQTLHESDCLMQYLSFLLFYWFSLSMSARINGPTPLKSSTAIFSLM